MTNSATEKKDVNFIETEEHVKLVETVKPFISVDKGIANFDASKAIDAALKELGTSEKEVRNAYKKVTAVNNAVRRAFGEAALADMAKHTGVDEVSIDYHVAQEKVSLTSRRKSEARNPSTGETIVSYGNTQIRRSVKGSTKQNTSISEHLKAIGAKKLA